MTDVKSNRLPALAAEIKQAHESSNSAAQKAVGFAIEAGKKLLEAKKLVKRGDWLPWIRENCGFSVRTAQGYMRLANAKAQRVAHLSVREALKALSEPRDLTDLAGWMEDPWGWAERQCKAPINKIDLGSHKMLSNKLIDQLSVPGWAGALLNCNTELAALIPVDEIGPTLKALAPVAKGDFESLKIDYRGVNAVEAQAVITMTAQRLVGKILPELSRPKDNTGREGKALADWKRDLDAQAEWIDEFTAISARDMEWKSKKAAISKHLEKRI